jgi:hypothetical protein
MVIDLPAFLTEGPNMHAENSVFDESFFPDQVPNLDRESSELRKGCHFVDLSGEKRRV